MWKLQVPVASVVVSCWDEVGTPGVANYVVSNLAMTYEGSHTGSIPDAIDISRACPPSYCTMYQIRKLIPGYMSV